MRTTRRNWTDRPKVPPLGAAGLEGLCMLAAELRRLRVVRASKNKSGPASRPRQNLRHRLRERLVAFALQALAQQLPVTPHSFRLLPRLALRGLLVVPAHLHFAENALALHLFLQRAQGLVDIVVTDEDLHG